MKKIFLLKVFALLAIISYSQNGTLFEPPAQISNAPVDTSKIYNCKIFKKGFYNTYQEFLNNSPSILVDFTTTFIYRSKADSTIIAGKFNLTDSNAKVKRRIWGFCDGTNIFVRAYGGPMQKNIFCKLSYVGPNPYFTHKYKDATIISLPISPIVTIASAAVSATSIATAKYEYELSFINSKGAIVNTPVTFNVEKWKIKLG